LAVKHPIASFAVLTALLACAAVAVPTPAPGAKKSTPLLDKGVFIVTYQGHALATESFSYESDEDSLIALSEYIQLVRGGDTLRKVTFAMIKASDYDLRLYQSTLTLGRKKLVRGLTFGDTTVAAFREDEKGGEGTAYRRPPGRLYAMEANSYILFDIIARNLARREFTRWPVQLFSLGEQDTISEALATDLGSETIRWGEKPVVARKISMSEGDASFLMWIGPQKYMLRLEEPNLGLVVERKAPPVKAAPRPTPH
jgi:hypothetical protein